MSKRSDVIDTNIEHNPILFILQQFPLKNIFRHDPATLIILKRVHKEFNRYIEEQVKNDQYFWYDIFKYSFPDALISIKHYCVGYESLFVYNLTNDDVHHLDLYNLQTNTIYKSEITQFFLEYTQQTNIFNDVESYICNEHETVTTIEMQQYLINNDILKGYTFAYLDKSLYEKSLLDKCINDEKYGRDILDLFKLISPCGIPPTQYCFTSHVMLRSGTISFLHLLKINDIDYDDEDEEYSENIINGYFHGTICDLINSSQIEFTDIDIYKSYLTIDALKDIRDYIKKINNEQEEEDDDDEDDKKYDYGKGPSVKIHLHDNKKEGNIIRLYRDRFIYMKRYRYCIEDLINIIIEFIGDTYKYDDYNDNKKDKTIMSNLRKKVYDLLRTIICIYIIFDNNGKLLYQTIEDKLWIISSSFDGEESTIDGMFFGELYDSTYVDKEELRVFIESIDFPSLLKKQQHNMNIFGTLDPLYWKTFLLERMNKEEIYGRTGIEYVGNNDYWFNLTMNQITWINKYNDDNNKDML